MCCFFASLLFFGPRLAFLVYWLIPYGRLKIATAFSGWFWPLLGLIFLPWTTLIYTLVYGGPGPYGGIAGFDWLWLGIAFIIDIASYGGGAGSYRKR